MLIIREGLPQELKMPPWGKLDEDRTTDLSKMRLK
jgi:hypothetical protein